MPEDGPRAPLDREMLAEQIVVSAWQDLPAYDRQLLVNIGASHWQVTTRSLGRIVDDLLRSAGYAGVTRRDAAALDDAAGVWIAELRLVLINAAHHALEDLDDLSYEAMLARIAWYEWAHALSVVRATREDVVAGERLLALAPDGVADVIRRGGYRRVEYIHELVAEIYALLMSRRRRGQHGQQPRWLDDEIYELVRRVSGRRSARWSARRTVAPARMIRALTRRTSPPMAAAFVYLLRCRDGSLYCGWTSDLDRRLAAHRAGRGSRYTASRLPVDLAFARPMADRSAALREEARIKRLTRAQKLALVAGRAG